MNLNIPMELLAFPVFKFRVQMDLQISMFLPYFPKFSIEPLYSLYINVSPHTHGSWHAIAVTGNQGMHALFWEQLWTTKEHLDHHWDQLGTTKGSIGEIRRFCFVLFSFVFLVLFIIFWVSMVYY